jgi:hypothetical protein
MPTECEKLGTELVTKRGRLASYFEKGIKDGKPDWTTEEVEQVRTLNTEIEAISPKWLELKKFEADKLNNDRELARLNETSHPSSHGSGIATKGSDGANHNDGYERRQLGDLFLSTKSYKGYVANGRQGDYRGSSSLPDFATKTLFQRVGGFDPFVNRQPGAVFAPQQMPKVADLIPAGSTTEQSIKWMLETTNTNNAVETTEATTYPESVFAYAEQLTPVQKIAVSLPITDEQLADASMIQDMLNNRMDLQLRQRLDLQCLIGSGTVPNLQGLYTLPGINSTIRGSDIGADAIYKAMTQIMVSGFADPTGVVMHPVDWQNIRLAKTADGAYIYGPPSTAVSQVLWGLPVITTTFMPVTTALVGAFLGYTQLFYRTGIEFEVANQHASNFTAGILVIRAQLRAALLCYRKLALAKVTGL